MIKAKIVDENIGFEMISSEFFSNRLKKYETNEEPELLLSSSVVSNIEIPNDKAILKTRFYDLYCVDNRLIQIQHSENSEYIIGKIIYDTKHIQIEVLPTNIEETEYLLTQYAVTWYITNKREAILMHASSILYNDYAYLFSAKSGTGKSTHTALWRKYMGVTNINDDKNIILFENNKLYCCGNPWSGKHGIDTNIKALVKGIIFLDQAKKNNAIRINKMTAFRRLMTQINQPGVLYDKDKWQRMLQRILDVKCYHLECNISEEAVDKIAKLLEEDYED